VENRNEEDGQAMETTDAATFRMRSVAFEAFGPTVVNSIGHGAILPVLALHARDLGAGVDLAAFVVALLGIGQMFSALPIGAMVARIGERRTLVLSGLVDVAAMLLAWQAGSVLALAVAILVSGATMSAFMQARQGFLIDAVPMAQRARAMSTLGASHRVGLLLGPVIGAGVIHVWGLAEVFVLAAAMSLASAAMAWWMRDLTHATRAEQRSTGHLPVRTVLRENVRSLLTLGTSVVVISACRSVRITLLPLWADHIGMNGTETSLMFAVAAAFDILFFLPGGWLMDHKGRAWVAVPVVLSMALAALALPLVTSTPAVFAIAIVIAMGNGLGSGIVMTTGADTAPLVGRAQYLGGWRLCGDIGNTSGPLVISAVAAVAPLAAASMAFGGLALIGTAWVGHWTLRLDATLRRGGVSRAGPGPRST
ncbi:MFS transporter, partial [Nocardioides sp. AE5]|uniref:MFS transporter n=1 Tax=Nocardioides sp. AE5 TaxID=2962573 RepID=UPI0028812689